VRRVLDRVYTGSAVLAVIGLFAVGVVTLAQIVARFLGTYVPSAVDFAGFSMGASAFLGLAYTLRKDGHIRVRLVIDKLPKRFRRPVEIVSLFIAVLIVGYYAYFTCLLLWRTYEFGEYTLGLIVFPKWIPMVAMPVGVVILFIAFVEELVSALRGRDPSYWKHSVTDSDVPKDSV